MVCITKETNTRSISTKFTTNVSTVHSTCKIKLEHFLVPGTVVFVHNKMLNLTKLRLVYMQNTDLAG